jgi:hypothetical protein
MERALSELTSPAARLGLLAALVWGPLTGMPTWSAISRARLASTLLISVAVGVFVFLLARQFGALVSP